MNEVAWHRPAHNWTNWVLFVCLAAFGWTNFSARAEDANPAAAVDYGTVVSVDPSGVVTFIPWTKKKEDARTIPTSADTSVTIALAPGKVTDIAEGMWIKIEETDADGKAKKISAGPFLSEDGDKVVIFKGMPEEFILYGSDGWYTNTAGGCKFKVQPMGAGKEPTNPGSNLRPATYKEPAGGFVFYFPLTLKGAVINWGGSKPGSKQLDADGKVLINKDTCTDKYFKHLKNPARPEAGYVSGLTELTIRKLPKRP